MNYKSRQDGNSLTFRILQVNKFTQIYWGAQMTGQAQLHHVGIAVERIDDALRFYQDVLGMSPGEETNTDGARILHLHSPTAEIELLEPCAGDGPIGKFIKKHGPGIHHICMKVPNLKAALDSAREKGYDLIDSEPRVGSLGRMVAFIHPKSTDGILIELTEG